MEARDGTNREWPDDRVEREKYISKVREQIAREVFQNEFGHLMESKEGIEAYTTQRLLEMLCDRMEEEECQRRLTDNL